MTVKMGKIHIFLGEKKGKKFRAGDNLIYDLNFY
jgi:hypothetical protein